MSRELDLLAKDMQRDLALVRAERDTLLRDNEQQQQHLAEARLAALRVSERNGALEVRCRDSEEELARVNSSHERMSTKVKELEANLHALELSRGKDTAEWRKRYQDALRLTQEESAVRPHDRRVCSRKGSCVRVSSKTRNNCRRQIKSRKAGSETWKSRCET